MAKVTPLNRSIVNELGRPHRYKLEEMRRRANEFDDEKGTASESHTVSVLAKAITVTGKQQIRFITVDGSGASTDLETIYGGNAGEIAILQSASDARDIVVKAGVSIDMGFDFTLNITKDKLSLICISSGVWHCTGRHNAGS